MTGDNIFYNANLNFLLKFTDGFKKEEIEAELYRVIFQVKEMTHYDRITGGSFENLEQEKETEITGLIFIMNLIESIYRLNESRNFKPYIIVGYNDIKITIERGEYIVSVEYMVLQDLQIKGVATAKMI